MTLLSCPACGESMHTKSSGSTEVDVCESCNAVWLDRGEFDALIGQKFAGMNVEDLLAMSQYLSVVPRECPRDASRMTSIFFQDIELDRCPICQGIFLDGSDRAILRRRTQLDSAGQSDRPEDAPLPDTAPRIDEADEIEVDFEAAHREQITVDCAGCGNLVAERRTIKRIDAYWCEECVIEGNYPGSHGPPVQRRIREAAQTMAAETTRLGFARDARDLRARNQDRITYYKGRSVRGEWTHEEYSVLFDRVGLFFRDFAGKFRRKKNE